MKQWILTHKFNSGTDETTPPMSYLDVIKVMGDMFTELSGEQTSFSLSLSSLQDWEDRQWHIQKTKEGYVFIVNIEDDEDSGFILGHDWFYKRGDSDTPVPWHGDKSLPFLPSCCFVSRQDIAGLIGKMETQEGLRYSPDRWLLSDTIQTNEDLQTFVNQTPPLVSAEWEVTLYPKESADDTSPKRPIREAFASFQKHFHQALLSQTYVRCDISQETGASYSFETTQKGVIIQAWQDKALPSSADPFFARDGNETQFCAIPSTPTRHLALRCFLTSKVADKVITQLCRTNELPYYNPNEWENARSCSSSLEGMKCSFLVDGEKGQRLDKLVSELCQGQQTWHDTSLMEFSDFLDSDTLQKYETRIAERNPSIFPPLAYEFGMALDTSHYQFSLFQDREKAVDLFITGFDTISSFGDNYIGCFKDYQKVFSICYVLHQGLVHITINKEENGSLGNGVYRYTSLGEDTSLDVLGFGNFEASRTEFVSIELAGKVFRQLYGGNPVSVGNWEK